jgi:1,4-dihydroxy-2-naphthoyl-CoA synthase
MSEEQDGAVVEEKDEVLYEVDNGLAWITINRPHRYNAYRGRTIEDSPEVIENVAAFNEKRPPDFSPFREGAYRGA